MTRERLGKLLLIVIGLGLVYLFANGGQTAFVYQNF